MSQFMSERDKWRLAFLRGQASPAMAGMEDPYAVSDADYQQANQDFTSQENNIQAMRAYANSLRGSPMPEGRTVGPSNIYVGPNWGETLGHAAQQVMGGYMAGQANEREAALGEERQGRADALARIAAADRGREQQRWRMGYDMDVAGMDQELALAAADRTSREETARLNRESSEGIAKRGQEGQNQRDRAGQPYMLDGKVVNIVEAQGKYHWGSIDGPVVPPEVMARAVEYRPGTDKGTAGDEYKFQMPVEESGQATPDFMGNFLTGDYFDTSTGVLNPERWLGAVGLGPDGKMVQATQSQMGTAVLEPMAQRMEEINLRPWTEKEIETITQDFPDANSKYPDWANFTYNIMVPRLNARFAEAIQSGRSSPEVRDQVMGELLDDIIEGARKNGMNLRDLEQLGVPKERIKDYLRRIQ